MIDINDVWLEGSLSRPPRYRKTQAGEPCARVSLVTRKDDATYDRHNLVFFGNDAERIRPLARGARLSVRGSLRTRRYADRDTGLDCYITEVLVGTCEFPAAVPAGD